MAQDNSAHTGPVDGGAKQADPDARWVHTHSDAEAEHTPILDAQASDVEVVDVASDHSDADAGIGGKVKIPKDLDAD